MHHLFGGIYENKKILVTGHTGFKGSWMCLLLKELGADVYGYALEPPTNPSLFVEAGIDKFVKSNIADIRDYSKLERTVLDIEPEIVFHLAAQPLVRLAYKKPLETYETNIMGTLNLLESVRKIQSVKALVNITTDKCYENKEWFWGYREDDRLGGYDPYSSSKACSEIVTAAYRNSYYSAKDVPHTAIATARAGNVIGGGDWAMDRLIPDFIRSIENNQKVIIRYPQSIRPWQHVLEPLTGYLLLGNKLSSEGQAFTGSWNFGPDDSDARSVEWIISKLSEYWGDNAGYEISTIQEFHESKYLKLDCSKAKALLNWHPRWNIEKALKSIVSFSRARQAKKDLKAICIQQIKEYYEQL